jgi:N-acetylglucosamine-6-sulfatase
MIHFRGGRSDLSRPVSKVGWNCWLIPAALFLAAPAAEAQQASDAPRNVVFILSDDHRFDFMGFHANAPEWLETPSLDRMARGGAHLANAFVPTSLCSPSRASVLTGQYAHRHGVVDNHREVRKGTRFFPQDLQRAGYRTSFIGKWHMGHDSDEPRPGFDHWVSFPGQGRYNDQRLNINGQHHDIPGYITDVLTDLAVDWLDQHRASEPDRPFFLYLSHKAVHSEFVPAERHKGYYANATPRYPETMPLDAPGIDTWPAWVREQRSSWHGVDYMYHGQIHFDEFYRLYAEALLGLDESVGRVLDYLERNGLAENTLVIYMGDNGFSFGEHGLIDKRHALEESMRVPMLAWAPGMIRPGTVVAENVANIDIMPTVLEFLGVTASADHVIDGESFLSLLRGESRPAFRDELLYAYYWEWNHPQTPTQFALRTPRYKYVYTHGMWDIDMLFDLQEDPAEKYNLARSPEYQPLLEELRDRLFLRLEELGALQMPELRRPSHSQLDRRRPPGEPSTDPLLRQ